MTFLATLTIVERYKLRSVCSMKASIKLCLAISFSAALLASLTATAMALRSISVNERNLTASGIETFAGSNGVNVICNLTLVATLNRVIAKRAGALAGQIIDVRPRTTRTLPCTNSAGGTAEIVAVLNLPWSVNYNAILGTLPRISGVLLTIERTQFLLAINLPIFGEGFCLFEGNVPFLITVGGGGELNVGTPLTNNENLVIDLIGEQPCPALGRLRGELTVAARKPSIDLI